MAHVQFYDSLPSGFRLKDLFVAPASGISLTADIQPNLAAFEIRTSKGRISVVYYGPSLSLDQGLVAAVSFGSEAKPWVVYGSAADATPQATYGVGLATFHAGGVSTAASIMAGADYLRGSSKGDYLEGYNGNDTLPGGRGADTMVGGIGDDWYHVSSHLDRVFEPYRAGFDTIIASTDYRLPQGAWIEVLQASPGRATLALSGNTYSNRIVGNDAANTLAGGGGRDTLEGGNGNDVYLIDSRRTSILEKPRGGSDTVLTSVNYTLTGGSAIEKLVADGDHDIHLTGNSGKNSIFGNDASNLLQGMGGNDIIYGGHGSDRLRGGTGNDSLYGGDGTDLLFGEGGHDTLYGGSENGTLSGGAGNDVLYGYWNDDMLEGGSSNDAIYGHTGNDTLLGGPGQDTLTSGEGYDAFVFDTSLNERTNVDILTDFNPWADQFRLKAAIFKGIGRPGALSADTFWIGAKAQTELHHIIYDKDAGVLYYDRDGSGSAHQNKFAVVGNIELSAGAFSII